MESRRFLVTAAAVLTLLPAIASANSSNTVTDIIPALKRQGESTQVANNDNVTLPKQAQDRVILQGDRQAVSIDLPATGAPEFRKGLAIYKGNSKDNEIAIQKTDNGVRALIHIDSEKAPEHYKFHINGAAWLEKQIDGSVFAFDLFGKQLGTIDTPWATDKNGKSVLTYYEIDGTTLIQVVAHRGGDFNYGITADPDWAHVATCAASIGILVATNMIAAFKIAKVGGAVKAARIILKAKNKSARIQAIKQLLGEVTGISGVIAHCS